MSRDPCVRGRQDLEDRKVRLPSQSRLVSPSAVRPLQVGMAGTMPGLHPHCVPTASDAEAVKSSFSLPASASASASPRSPQTYLVRLGAFPVDREL